MRHWLSIIIAIIALMLVSSSPYPAAAADALAEAHALDHQGTELYRKGRYAEAEPLLKRSLAIYEKVLGPADPDLSASLDNLARVYQDEGRYGEAEPFYKRSLAIRQKALGREHPEVAKSLNNLAVIYAKQGRYREAEPLYKRSLMIRERTASSDPVDIGESLNNIAELYREQGRYKEAEPLYVRSLAIWEKTLGPEHPLVAATLSNLGALYWAEGRYADAVPVFKRSLAIREKALGPEHPEVALNLNNLADAYRHQGRFAEAEPLYKRSSIILERVLGPNHPLVATSLQNLAQLYHDEGRYGEAEPVYKRSLGIFEKAYGPEHPDVATSDENLAELYRNQGRYGEAEPLYKRSLAIYEKVLGPEHPNTATSLNNLAGLYKEEGRDAEAEALYKRGLSVVEKALGPESLLVGQSLNNLAVLYISQSRYREAEALYKRSLGIVSKTLGPEHPVVAQSLNNLAAVYQRQGRYAEAEPLYKRSLAIREKELGPEHTDLARSLNDLASLYRSQGRYAESEPLYKRSLGIFEKAFGPGHPAVANTLNNIADLYGAEGHYTEAAGFSRRAVSILETHLSEWNTRRDNGAEAERRSERTYFTGNIALLYAAYGPTAAVESFRVVQMAEVSGAGAGIAAMTARFAIGGGAQSEIIRERQDVVQQWRALDGDLLKAVSKPMVRRDGAAETALRAEFAEASRKLDLLDARMAAEFPIFAELSNPTPLDAQKAQALLAPDEALLVYLTTGPRTWLWVLRHDRIALHLIALDAKALTNMVSALRQTLEHESNPDVAPFPAKEAYGLYQKLLGPALPLLRDAHNLLVVPDGALESLPLSVLVTKPPDRDPQTPVDHRGIAWLARDYAVTVLPSVSALRGLRQFASSEHASARFLGIGNPVLSGTASSKKPTLTSLFRSGIADADAVRELPPLPETADELRAIARTFGASESDLLLGPRASEPVLRQTPLDRYRVVAFATHGLVSGELKGLAEPALVLTPPAEATAENDGLLTASKIATLKFNADWVVLSACNTAAGDGTPDGGGLSGLAKAFFYAGARSLLVSHWPVRSDAAVKLTTGAFAELAKDPTIGRAEALRRSMMAMLDPSEPAEFAYPLAWAPFVLAGEGGAGR